MKKTTKDLSVIEQAYQEAIKVLDACAKPTGFYASGLKGGYEATWARDSMTMTLGAALVGNRYKAVIKKSLDLLAKNQSYLGQIPNCVGSYNLDRRSDVTFNTVDSNLWYILGLLIYSSAFDDKDFYAKHQRQLTLALIWLAYQDPDEVRLIAQQPTMDWMDAFPHKYGYTIHAQAMYYGVLNMVGKQRQAKHIKRVINGEIEKYISLYDDKLGYYYPWGWKNHEDKREHEEWFDTTGNLLAILTGLATPKIAKNILAHIDKKKISGPYPCRVIDPPLKKGDKAWHDYFENCDAREQYHYLNGGVWPFIGGFYVAALVKMKDYEKAEAELTKLAEANLRELDGHGFNEWLDGKTGEPKGEPYQGWSAGTYIYAYHCLKKKKALFF
ncbi:MAG TPA: glycoside hydrolase 100 family protein [bacterium]|nr:glycoside hydrolase 100 family protein [bacterium]